VEEEKERRKWEGVSVGVGVCRLDGPATAALKPENGVVNDPASLVVDIGLVVVPETERAAEADARAEVAIAREHGIAKAAAPR